MSGQTAAPPAAQPTIPAECQQWLAQNSSGQSTDSMSQQHTQWGSADGGCQGWEQSWPPDQAQQGTSAEAAEAYGWAGGDAQQQWPGAGDYSDMEQARQQIQLLQAMQAPKPQKTINPFQGTNVIPTQSQEDMANQNEGKRFLGRIKRFFGGKAAGYGFIDCPEARARYGYDVYLHAKQMHGCEVGEFVSFTIVRNAKGEPQARNLVRAVEAASVEAKRQQEAMKQQEMLQAKRSSGNLFAAMAGAAAPGSCSGGVEMDEEAAKRFQQSLKSQRK